MNRYALTVGINYPGTSAELAGCVNDAHDWGDVLAARGYDVHALLDRAATREAILDHLTQLVSVAGYRDRVVFTFSGHGTFVPDRDGDEADGRDEALCPVDLWTAGVVTDDALYEAVSRARRGVRVLIVADSCYSGTLHRAYGVSAAASTEEPAPRQPRFLPPARWAPIGERPLAWQRAASTAPGGRPRRGALIMSACSDREVAWDASFGGRPNGAFTRVALDLLDAGPGLTYREWHDRVRLRLPSEQYPQTPQLDGTRYQKRWAALG